MLLLLQPLNQLVHRRHAPLVGDSIDQIRHTLPLRHRRQLGRHRVLEETGHPHHPLETTVGRDELGARQVELPHPHHAGSLEATAGHTRQRRERHPRRRHARILTADHHHPLRLGDVHHDALETPAGRHRVLHNRVHRHLWDRPLRVLHRRLVRPRPIPPDRVNQIPLRHRLVRARRIDLVRRLAVQPVVGPAQTQPLRAHDAHVRRRKRLAQRTIVERIHRLVRQIGQPPVAEIVRHPRLLQPFRVLLRIRHDLHLHLVHDRAELRVEAGVHDIAEMLQIEPLIRRPLRDPDPRDIPLAHVLDTRSPIHEIVNLALQHRLEILLHLAAGHLDHQPHIHRPADLHILEVGAHDLDLPVLHLVHLCHTQILEGAALLPAELHPHVGAPDHLPLERRPVRHRHRHLRDLDLHPTDLDARLHQLGRPLRVRLRPRPICRNLIPRHRDHVLVPRHPRRQNLWDDRVGDGGEPVGDGPGRSRVLEIVHLPQRQHERKHPELVVQQNIPPLAGLQPAERQRRPRREPQRVDRRDRILAEGHDVRIVPHLHTLLAQLVDHRTTVRIAAQEDQNIPLLQLPHDAHRSLVRPGRPHDRGEARHAAVDQLDTPRTQLDVVDGAVQMAIARKTRIIRPADQLKPGVRLRLFSPREPDPLNRLRSQQRRHAAVQRLPQIWHPHALFGERME